MKSGEELADGPAGELAGRLKEMSPGPPTRDPGLGAAIRDPMLEAFREDGLIGYKYSAEAVRVKGTAVKGGGYGDKVDTDLGDYRESL